MDSVPAHPICSDVDRLVECCRAVCNRRVKSERTEIRNFNDSAVVLFSEILRRARTIGTLAHRASEELQSIRALMREFHLYYKILRGFTQCAMPHACDELIPSFRLSAESLAFLAEPSPSEAAPPTLRVPPWVRRYINSGLIAGFAECPAGGELPLRPPSPEPFEGGAPRGGDAPDETAVAPESRPEEPEPSLDAPLKIYSNASWK